MSHTKHVIFFFCFWLWIKYGFMRPANNASCFYLQFLSLICIVLLHIICLFFEPCKDHKQRETETPLLSSKSKCFAVALGGIIIHPNTSCQSWGGNGLSLQGSCYSTQVEKCAVDEGFCCTDLFCSLLENSIPGSLPSQENNNKVYEALNHGPVPWNHPWNQRPWDIALLLGGCAFLSLFFFFFLLSEKFPTCLRTTDGLKTCH